MPYINAILVGFLDDPKDLIVGRTPDDFKARLGGLVQCASGVMGLTVCPLCHPDGEYDAPLEPKLFNSPCGMHRSIESSEIMITGSNDVIYRAPCLIFHLVMEHGYRPPDDFVNAVLDEQLKCLDIAGVWRRFGEKPASSASAETGGSSLKRAVQSLFRKS